MEARTLTLLSADDDDFVEEHTTVLNSHRVAFINWMPMACFTDKGFLFVGFKDGSSYVYGEFRNLVPRAVYDELINAESVGHALNELVKGVYRFVRVRDKMNTNKTISNNGIF